MIFYLTQLGEGCTFSKRLTYVCITYNMFICCSVPIQEQLSRLLVHCQIPGWWSVLDGNGHGDYYSFIFLD